MTREIKFRVWTGLRMEYNIMAGWLGAFYVQGIDPTDSACMSSHNTIYSKQASVMQFTGLLDKNGKEIYEGDLLKNIDTKYIHPVVFDKGAFCFGSYEGFPLGGAPLGLWEVLGNLYENPDLLTKH